VAQKLTPARLAAAGLFLLLVLVVVLYVTPSHSDYVFLPDRAHALAPLVKIQGERPPTGPGGIYFVDVRFRKARLLEQLFPGVAGSGASVVPVKDVRARGVSESQQRRQDLHDMALSQRIAAAVALKRLGYPVRDRPTGILVDGFVSKRVSAARVLRLGDRIVAVDGKSALSFTQLRRLVGRHRPGERVRVTYIRDGKTREATVVAVADPKNPKRTLIGIGGEPTVHITIPIQVRIDTRGVGGPSAGLAFALDLMQELGRNVDHGYRVAATGALGLDGSVGEIGAIKQKTIGAREAHVDVFLVPKKNAPEARRFAHGLRVIPVEDFPQALHALATLRPKPGAGA
jgi:PDZ domain-containing protein